LRRTLDFADSLKVPYSLNLLTPYVGTEIRERAEEWGIRILSSDWRHYGQGQPLTATPEVGPRHLKRAVNRFRRALRQYLDELLKSEQQGDLSGKSAEELERHRRLDFLRKLIGGEILERYGTVLPGEEEKGVEELSRSLAPQLGMPEGEVQKHLQPHVRKGHIRLSTVPGDANRWFWASS
jgi:hypothetical protein